MRESSRSRPITGSSFPSRANSVKSRPNVLRVGVLGAFFSSASADDSGAAASPDADAPWAPAAMNFSAVTPALKSSCATAFSPSLSMAVTRCDVLTGVLLPASSAAISKTLRVRADTGRGPRWSVEDPSP